jgi:hypothetical protein
MILRISYFDGLASALQRRLIPDASSREKPAESKYLTIRMPVSQNRMLFGSGPERASTGLRPREAVDFVVLRPEGVFRGAFIA